MKRCRLKRNNFQIINKVSKEKKTLDKAQNGNDFIADVRRSSSLEDVNKKLNEIDFFDLMQNYRIADMSDQENVVNRFEAVKEWIRQNCA